MLGFEKYELCGCLHCHVIKERKDETLVNIWIDIFIVTYYKREVMNERITALEIVLHEKLEGAKGVIRSIKSNKYRY